MAKEVLNATVEMNPYEKHFAKPVLPKDQKELDKINGFLRELAKRLNASKDYNIEELAKKAGIDDLEFAERIAEKFIQRVSDDSQKR